MSKSHSDRCLVVGTRGSPLARAQTQWVVDQLRAAHPELDIRTEIISTTGDRLRDRPLPEIGGKGLFTEQLERALLDETIDLAIHSAKDLPTTLSAGLDILAFPTREDPRDAWVSADGTTFDDLPEHCVIGTSSLRRQAQLRIGRPRLSFIALRGNVDTRIKKVRRGDCAGAVLAMAGLRRLHLAHHITHPFDPGVMLPAPGQGALALEGRADDQPVREILLPVHDVATAAAVGCERAVLARLDAGCRAPVAVLAMVEGQTLRCDALVCDPAGLRQARTSLHGLVHDLDKVVERIVSDLLAQGADEIIAACRPSE